MCNFRNPCKSFAIRHQLSLAVRLNLQKFVDTDFFVDATAETTNPILHSRPESFDLKSTQYPHPLNKSILFKVYFKRHKFWIEPKAYHGLKIDGSIVVEGPIYELKKRPRVGQQLKEFDLLQIKFATKWVRLEHLSHRVDFLLQDIQGEDFFGEYKALIRGFI